MAASRSQSKPGSSVSIRGYPPAERIGIASRLHGRAAREPRLRRNRGAFRLVAVVCGRYTFSFKHAITMKFPDRLTVISDEISQDLPDLVRFAIRKGLITA